MEPSTPRCTPHAFGRRAGGAAAACVAACVAAWVAAACTGRAPPAASIAGDPEAAVAAGDQTPGASATSSAATTAPGPPRSLAARIEKACSGCHPLPPSDALPRGMWRPVIDDMFHISGYDQKPPEGLRPADIAGWFEARAPSALPLARGRPVEAGGLRFHRRGLSPKKAPPVPAISHVAFLDLLGDARLELVACDMRHGLLLYCRPYADRELRVAAKNLGTPCHVEVCDLNQDGLRDLLVTDLGGFDRGDHAKGRVLWLRRIPKKLFEVVPLGTGLPRPDDARLFDADGDGDLDVGVACFGWRKLGKVVILENRTRRWSEPRFAEWKIDSRHGAVDIPAVDLDGDGRPEIVSALAQEIEKVVAWRAGSDGLYRGRTLYAAPHPAWGSNGVSVCDLDKDGDPDLLVTNGDTLDDHLLKPYHEVAWLRNDGGLRFTRRPVGRLYGVHDAQAADLDSDGDLDVVATAFLPQVEPALRQKLRIESLVWFEQEGGTFRRHVLESASPVHMTLAAADYDLDGDVDLALGQTAFGLASWDRLEDWVLLFEARR